MAGKPFSVMDKGNPVMGFHVPNIQGKTYAPGQQPNSPGESYVAPIFPYYSPVPWPNMGPSLNALANHPGIPRDQPIQISNNSVAPAPDNYLFLAGIVGKSRG